MSYLSERHRVEIILPAQMMLAAFIAGTTEPRKATPEFQKLKKALIDASWEPVADLPPKEAHKVLQRVTRIHDRVTKALVKTADIPKLALIEFHFMKIIIEADYLQYTEGSSFETGIMTFMNALQEHAAIERLNNSSEKQARRLLKILHQEGLYRAVQIDDETGRVLPPTG